MIDALTFENNDSVVYDFMTDFVPISDFNVTVDEVVDDSRVKPQAHGIYATPTYRRGMTIDIQGTILADDYTDYNTKRQDMVNTIFGANFTDLVSQNQLGEVHFTPTGATEAWVAPVTVRAFTAPKNWAEGAYGQYMVTFFSWNPYFYGGTNSANLYRWS